MEVTVTKSSGRIELAQTFLEHMIWPILAVTLVGAGIFVPKLFTNLRSLQLVMYSSVPLGLLVLAESTALLSGNFDLSIGSIAGFSAVFTGMLIGTGPATWGLISNPYVAIVIILAIGSLIGLINGVMIAKFNVDPFLQTLAMLIIFAGAKTTLTTQPVTGLPSEYLFLGRHTNIAIGVLFVIFIAFGFFMRYTNIGQSIYAIGSAEESARAVGVNTDRILILVYVISGLLAGLAGLILTGYTTIVPPDIAENMVFPAFAAAVIGGISLEGGRGHITGALGGVILLGVVQSSLNLSQVNASQIEMAQGLVLFIAILLYNMKENIRNRLLSG